MIQEFQRNGIRTSIFVDPRLDMIEANGYRPQTHYTEAFAYEYGLGTKGIDPGLISFYNRTD
jgi:pyridoxine 5-phosphate synthase